MIQSKAYMCLFNCFGLEQEVAGVLQNLWTGNLYNAVKPQCTTNHT